MRLVRSTFNKHVGAKRDKKAEFIDTRFVTMLSRNYPKFKNATVKKIMRSLRGWQIVSRKPDLKIATPPVSISHSSSRTSIGLAFVLTPHHVRYTF